MNKTLSLIAALLLAGAVSHAGYFGGNLRPHGHTSNADGGVINDLPVTGDITVENQEEGRAAFFGTGGLLDGVDNLTYDVDSGSFTVGDFTTETIVVVSTAGDIVSSDTLTFSATTSGSNRALIVTVGAFFAPVDTITYNGVSMTRATSTLDASTQYYSEIWYLAAPASGTHDVVVSVPGTFLINAHAVSLTGVAQTSTVLGTAVESGTAGSNSIAVSSTTGGMTIDAVAGPGTLTPATVGAGQTLVGSADLWVLSTSYKSGATAMSWTFAASDTFGHAVVSLNPATESESMVLTPRGISSTKVRAQWSGTQNIANGACNVMTGWTLEQYDTLGELVNGTTWTATTSGYYSVGMQVFASTVPVAGQYTVYLSTSASPSVSQVGIGDMFDTADNFAIANTYARIKLGPSVLRVEEGEPLYILFCNSAGLTRSLTNGGGAIRTWYDIERVP